MDYKEATGHWSLIPRPLELPPRGTGCTAGTELGTSSIPEKLIARCLGGADRPRKLEGAQETSVRTVYVFGRTADH